MTTQISSTIYNKALDLISRREHSTKELKDKLIKKFELTREIENVLDQLLKNDLLNDYRFCESYVSIRKRRGFGPKKISYELLLRGIPNSISDEVINDIGGWDIAAKKALSKKFKDKSEPDMKAILKKKNFLQNRGFTFKEIEAVFANDML